MSGPQRLTEVGNAFDLIGHGHMGKNLLANADPALRARIQAAAEAGDRAELLRILSQNTNLTTAPKARSQDMPYDMPAEPASRNPVPVGERLAKDPNITETVRQGFGPIADIPGMRLDAYGRMADAGGPEELLNLLGRSAPPSQFSVMDLLPDNSPLFSANTGMGGGGVAMDVIPGAAIPSSPTTALVPVGPRGLSAGGGGLIVPPGRGLTTTGGDLSVQGMESPAPRGLPAPNQLRLEGPTTTRPESPDVPTARQGGDGGKPPGGNPPPRRPGSPQPGPGRRNWLPAAAAAAAGAGAFKLGMDLMFPPNGERETLGDGEVSTADLAAETSPPPSVMTQEPAPLSPRDQAQELIRRLNLMRREAGGEVPEAPAMQREINRLLAMSNQTMAAASRGEVATGGNDYHMQAARMMAQLNDLRRRAGGEVPQARQMMTEIARLQRLGDAQRNARQAPRRAG